MDIDIDYDNMTVEQVNAILREHGYEPTLVGKYYRLVAEHEMLKKLVRTFLDDIYEFGMPMDGHIMDALQSKVAADK